MQVTTKPLTKPLVTMKKPDTLEEFKELIKSMDHRERFVFESTQGKPLEIYHTVTDEGYGDRNIKLQFQFSDKQPFNKLLKLWYHDYYKKIYDLLA